MPTATDRLSRHRRVLSQVPGRIPGWSGRLRFRDRLSNPLPDDEGVFRVAGIEVAIFPSPQSDRQTRTYADPTNMVVVPVADCDDLSEAKVKCVGERLHEFVETRLGQIPPDVEVDATILRSLAPLDSGVRAFLSQSAQVLSATNLLDRETHLRRLLVPNREEVFTLGHYGRVCSFETPEGPNVGRVLTNSRGASID